MSAAKQGSNHPMYGTISPTALTVFVYTLDNVLVPQEGIALPLRGGGRRQASAPPRRGGATPRRPPPFGGGSIHLSDGRDKPIGASGRKGPDRPQRSTNFSSHTAAAKWLGVAVCCFPLRAIKQGYIVNCIECLINANFIPDYWVPP
jgi:hypothetical protein